MWKVVKSLEGTESSFYVVPETWIYQYEGQCFVYYPSKEQVKDVTKAVLKRQKPESKWNDHPAEVLPNNFATFLDAKRVEADVVKLSKELWEDFVKDGYPPKEYGSGKRKHQPKNLKLPGEKTTTDTDGSTDSSDCEPVEDIDNFPSPPKKNKIADKRRKDEDRHVKKLGDEIPKDVERHNKKNEDDKRKEEGRNNKKNEDEKRKDEGRNKKNEDDKRKEEGRNNKKNEDEKRKDEGRNKKNEDDKRKEEGRNNKKNEDEKRKDEGRNKKNDDEILQDHNQNGGKRQDKKHTDEKRQEKKSTEKENMDIKTRRSEEGEEERQIEESRDKEKQHEKSDDEDSQEERVQREFQLQVDLDILNGDEELANALNFNESKEEAPKKSSKEKPSPIDVLYYVAKKLTTMEKYVLEVRDLLTKKPKPEMLKFETPCQDFKQVFSMEQCIKTDDNQYNMLVNVLTAKPNPNSQLHLVCNSVLRFVMSDTAAKRFCLTGSNGKWEFQKMKTYAAVVEAVQAVVKDASADAINSAMIAWLSQAQNRLDSKGGKKKKKKEGAKKDDKKKLPQNMEEVMNLPSDDEN